MTTIIPYNPSPTTPFAFAATLDGQPYIATVVWGLFGRRRYINLANTSGQRVFLRPMLGSPIGIAIQSISWELGLATVKTASNHGYAIADTVALTLSACSPAILNGKRACLITTATAFTFPLSPDPGIATALGKVDYNIDIAGGYFQESSLIYRQPSNAFEVSP